MFTSALSAALRAISLGQERTSLEGPAKILEHGQALFAQRADVGTDARMALSAFEGAKAARDLDPRLPEAEPAL